MIPICPRLLSKCVRAKSGANPHTKASASTVRALCVLGVRSLPPSSRSATRSPLRPLDRLRHTSSLPLVSFSCNTLPSRRTLKNSRLVCKKDDVHVCIMCLRAIMNYQVGGTARTFLNLIGPASPPHRPPPGAARTYLTGAKFN